VAKKNWYNYFIVTGHPAAAGSPPESSDPTLPPRRVVDMVPDAEGDATFDTPVSSPIDLSEIYTSAQIGTPAHGYTVLKVAEMLQSEHIRDLTADLKQRSVKVALEAAGVNVTDIVEDAVQRDRALDTYERVLQKHLEELRAQKEAENKQLEADIEQRVAELRGRIDQNNAEVRREEVRREQDALASWRVRKRQEEERIAEAVGHFVSPNPITSDAPVKGKGGANVR
jgi:hypothetical protein